VTSTTAETYVVNGQKLWASWALHADKTGFRNRFG
jgi:alkylation response protein AidB-like acyl-CoA dehydrogenase